MRIGRTWVVDQPHERGIRNADVPTDSERWDRAVLHRAAHGLRTRAK